MVNNWIYVLFFCFFSTLISYCQNQKVGKKEYSYHIDSSIVTPRDSNIFSSEGIISNDSLLLVSCEDEIRNPFGNIYNDSDIKNSLLKDFTIAKHIIDTSSGIESHTLKLIKNSTNLILYFDNDLEAASRSYILKGEIIEDNIALVSGIRIGISEKEFIERYFSKFPEKLQNKIHVIVIAFCVDDIIHYYQFINNKLISIKFVSDSSFDIEKLR